jgi:hypothetical protein
MTKNNQFPHMPVVETHSMHKILIKSGPFLLLIFLASRVIKTFTTKRILQNKINRCSGERHAPSHGESLT